MSKIYIMWINDKEKLQKKGVYQIRNTINGKVYIGSTTMTFQKRFWHHYHCLKTNKHKNLYLQRAWNKYGEENFIFEILSVCKKSDCFIKEQEYLDKISFKYNINPLATGTPNLSEEVVKRRAISLKKYYQENGTDKLKGRTPWNKGQQYISTDHLKVPKTKTSKLLESQKQIAINARNNMQQIEVFDLNNNSLGIWLNAYNLEEFSKSEENNLPIQSRFKVNERMGIPQKHLQYVNIIKACRTGNPYKGLFMKYVPSIMETL